LFKTSNALGSFWAVWQKLFKLNNKLKINTKLLNFFMLLKNSNVSISGFKGTTIVP